MPPRTVRDPLVDEVRAAATEEKRAGRASMDLLARRDAIDAEYERAKRELAEKWDAASSEHYSAKNRLESAIKALHAHLGVAST